MNLLLFNFSSFLFGPPSPYVSPSYPYIYRLTPSTRLKFFFFSMFPSLRLMPPDFFPMLFPSYPGLISLYLFLQIALGLIL